MKSLVIAILTFGSLLVALCGCSSVGKTGSSPISTLNSGQSPTAPASASALSVPSATADSIWEKTLQLAAAGNGYVTKSDAEQVFGIPLDYTGKDKNGYSASPAKNQKFNFELSLIVMKGTVGNLPGSSSIIKVAMPKTGCITMNQARVDLAKKNYQFKYSTDSPVPTTEVYSGSEGRATARVYYNNWNPLNSKELSDRKNCIYWIRIDGRLESSVP